MQRHLVAFSTIAAIFSLHAPCHGDWQLKKSDFSGQGYALRALLGKKELSETIIRRIGAGNRSKELPRLLDYAEDDSQRWLPRQNLEMVRAISQHSEGTHRERVIKTLIEFFRQPDTSSGETQRAPQERLEVLIRASSAMALARAQHVLAARVLIAAATANEEQDPEGFRLAQLALAAEPPSPEILQATQGWPPPPQREDTTTAPGLSSPSELIRAMQANPRNHKREHADWVAQIARLRTSQPWSEAWKKPQEWQQAFTTSKVWTLRALGLLAPQLKGIREQAVALAESRLNAAEPSERAAAAFCLSSLAPQEATSLLSHKDPAIRHAVLNQSHQGSLAQVARKVSAGFKPDTDSESNADALFALRTSLDEPSLWPTWSTRKLESLELYLAPSNEWRSPLAARFNDSRQVSRAPDFSLIDSWLESEDATVRAQTIRGLAWSHAASAPGLLIESYRFESNDAVRRSLCHAMRHRGLQQRPELNALFSLEIDPGCRARLRGHPDPEAQGFEVGWSLEKFVIIHDREGIAHRVRSAPDGFVALVHPNL